MFSEINKRPKIRRQDDSIMIPSTPPEEELSSQAAEDDLFGNAVKFFDSDLEDDEDVEGSAANIKRYKTFRAKVERSIKKEHLNSKKIQHLHYKITGQEKTKIIQEHMKKLLQLDGNMVQISNKVFVKIH